MFKQYGRRWMNGLILKLIMDRICEPRRDTQTCATATKICVACDVIRAGLFPGNQQQGIGYLKDD